MALIWRRDLLIRLAHVLVNWVSRDSGPDRLAIDQTGERRGTNTAGASPNERQHMLTDAHAPVRTRMRQITLDLDVSTGWWRRGEDGRTQEQSYNQINVKDELGVTMRM